MPFGHRQVKTTGAQTTSANSGTLVLGGDTQFASAEWLSLVVDVTAVSGTTPSLAVTLEWSLDGTTWATTDPTPDGFAAITTTGAKIKRFPVLANYYRVVWAITGTTPSFTFSVRELAINEG